MVIAPVSSQISLDPAVEPSQSGPLNRIPTPPKPAAQQQTPAELVLSRQLYPTQPQDQRLRVSRVEILGVKSVEFADIAAFFQPLSGTETSIGHLSNAAALATQRYQEAGYPLSFVYLPEQSFDQGIVRVIAVEGHISGLTISGDTGKSEKLLREIAQPLLDSQPLNKAQFERQTLLMARMENLEVKASAALPKTNDGATPLQLDVKRKPFVFNLGGELRQGDSKALATATLNDPFWGGSQWQFTSLLEKPSRERFLSATWKQWLNANGTTLRWNYTDFKGHDNFAGGFIDDITSQRRMELTVMHPLHLSATGSTMVGASLFGLNYEKNYGYPDFGLTIGDTEKVRALQAHWIWQKSSPQWAQNANVTFTQGIDALGASTDRYNNQNLPMLSNEAKLDFSRLSFDYALRWRFKNMMGAGFGIGGQASPHVLPVSERVSFGGTRYGRGYRRGEAAGDQGLGLSVEVNRMFAVKDGNWVKSWEPYFMYEHAKTWFKSDAFLGQELQSSTLGVRLSDSKRYSLDLSVSKPHGDKSVYNPDQKLRYGLTLTYQLDI